MTILYTSLREIKSFDPCPIGWKNILESQGKTKADNCLFPLKECLKDNSFSDVCWLLGKRKIELQIAVTAAKMCAGSVVHIKSADANAAADAANAAAAAYACAADEAAAFAAKAAAFAAKAAYTAYLYAAVAAATCDTAAYDAADLASDAQIQKNKQFLLDAILKYESEN